MGKKNIYLHWVIYVIKVFIRRHKNLIIVIACVPGSSTGKESACNAGALVGFLGQEDPLEKG